VAALVNAPAAAHTWYRDANGNVVGRAPATSAELLDYCLASPAHCSISVNHVSEGWQRHLQADRLNPIASTYKLVPLLVYAELVADGRLLPTRRLSRDDWARFWIGADGEELQPVGTGPIVDTRGRAYSIRRAGGRRLDGTLRRSWVYLQRPPRLTMDELVEVMIRYSDNAGPDWILHQFGERSFRQVMDRRLMGYHDMPASINAMFLTYFLNPEQPGLPAPGDRVLDAYSGFQARGYRDEVARWLARLEDRDFVTRARACQPAVLPWERRMGECPGAVREPGEARMRRLFNGHSMQSNTRTQTRLMTDLLQRTLLDPTAGKLVEHSLEYRLDPGRFRDPKFRNRFRRHGAKSGSFRTNDGLTVLTWTGYFESQPRADGSTARGAVSIHLRDLPGGERPRQAGAPANPDIGLELPLRFAEDVILNRNGLATAVASRLPDEAPRPELIARVERLEAHGDQSGSSRMLAMEVRVQNIGAAPTVTATRVALYLRRAAEGAFDPGAEPASQMFPVPPLDPGESMGVLFHGSVPPERDYAVVMLDPDDLVPESTETGNNTSDNNVQWERLHFATVNFRSIGTRRGALDAGDGVARRATSTAGAVTVRFEGPGQLPATVGRGDELVLAPGEANQLVGHIASRDGATRVRLQRPVDVSLSGVPFIIRRSFASIQAWEDARQGNLVAAGRIEVGILYGDGPFRCGPAAESGCLFDGERVEAMAVVDGSVTNAGHYMALEAAEGERHRGTAGTGVVLDGESTTRLGIRVRDHHTRIRGLELRGFGNQEGAAAIAVERARHVLLENLLIHDLDTTGASVAGVRAGILGDFTLRNTVIHGGATGVRIDRPNATGSVENCTVFGMSGWGIREGSGLLNVRNTVSMGNGEGDFQVRRGTQDHNLSSDETAAGPGALTGRPPEGQFRSLDAGSPDLRLRPTADAAGAGTVLYPAFDTDMEGEQRPSGPNAGWSMGADQ
jgi:hypothetical protein